MVILQESQVSGYCLQYSLFGDIWGFAGMLLGVPIFAVIYHLIKKWVFKRLQINGMENLSEEYEVEYPLMSVKRSLKADLINF